MSKSSAKKKKKNPTKTIKEPVCYTCENYILWPYCFAFPYGIPDDVRNGENDHSKPIKGDHEFQYVRADRTAAVERHHGPGPHPSGSEQSVHGSKGAGGAGEAGGDTGEEGGGQSTEKPKGEAKQVEMSDGTVGKIRPEYAGQAKKIIERAENVLAKAVKDEPEMTSMLQNLSELSGGRLVDLDTRLKKANSIVRKIQDKMDETGLNVDGAAAQLVDLVRYTMEFDTDDFVDDVLAVQSALGGRGWSEYDTSWKNYFSSGDDYDGYNTAMVSPSTNQVFELQYHTPDSLDIKHVSWGLYARFREMDAGSSEAESLFSEMNSLWTGYDKPKEWEKLPGVVQ